PDAKCIWHYREQLRKAEVFDALFDAFVERIEATGLLLNQGKIVDATMVKAPVQRNSRDETSASSKARPHAAGAPARPGKRTSTRAGAASTASTTSATRTT